jgi:hypothetical protein
LIRGNRESGNTVTLFYFNLCGNPPLLVSQAAHSTPRPHVTGGTGGSNTICEKSAIHHL